MHFEIDGWEIVPLVVDEGVSSLLLLRSQAPDPNSNITAVWAQRGPTAWSADAWVGIPRADVIAWAVEHLGCPDPLLDSARAWWLPDWVYDEALGAVVPADPEPYGIGLPLSHPLEPGIAALEEPGPVIQFLEGAGEPAAGGAPVSPGSGPGIGCLEDDCPPEMLWDAIAAHVEAEIAEEGTGDAAFEAVLEAAGCCACTERTWKTEWRPTGGWTCIAWSFLEDAPFSGACGYSISHQTTCTRPVARRCTHISAACVFTRTTQTSTETMKHCTTDLYDTLAAFCPDTDLPNLPVVAPPPFAGPPNGCSQGSTIPEPPCP